MDKKEDIILEENVNENELVEVKNSKKIKYFSAIIASTLIFAAVITLSINHFKIEIKEEATPDIRNLAFPISASRTYSLGSFNIAGQTVSIKYAVSVSGSSISNKIVISSGSGSFSFGNTGMSTLGKGSKTYSTTIFTIAAPQLTGVTLSGIAKGTLSWETKLQSGSGTSAKYSVGLSGTLNLGAQIKSGGSAFTSLTASGEGVLASATGYLTLSNGSVAKGSGFSMKMGNLKIHLKWKVLGSEKTYTITLYNGWSSI